MIRELPRDFWFFVVSRFASASALTMLRATVAWHVFDLTRSPFQLGLIGLVQFLPALALSLVGGVVADSYERRRIVLTAQTVPLLVGVVLAISGGWNSIPLPALYAAVVAVAAAAAFDNPARAAILPNLVGREIFPRAVLLTSTNQALAFASGPALAGLVIASAGMPVAYGITAVLWLLAMGSLSRIRPILPSGPRRELTLAAIGEGLTFVRRTPVVLGCMTLDMFAVIFGGATALLPVYANEILGVGPRGYGILSASLEAGALVTSLTLVALPTVRRFGRTLLLAVTAYGVATIVFGISRSFPVSLLAYALVGMADQVSVVMRATMIQLNTPDELRGRVSSVNFLFIGASNQLGAAESGFVAALTNPTFAVVSGGVACLLVVLLVAVRLPELRRYTLASAGRG